MSRLIETTALYTINASAGRNFDIDGTTYVVGKRFTGHLFGTQTTPGTYSYALLAYKAWKEGQLTVALDDQKGCGIIKWNGHTVVWKETSQNNYTIARGGALMSTPSLYTAIAGIAALKLDLFNPNVTDPSVEYFCNAVYFGFVSNNKFTEEDMSASDVDAFIKTLSMAAYVGEVDASAAPVKQKATKKVANSTDKLWNDIKAGKYRLDSKLFKNKDRIVPIKFLDSFRPSPEFLDIFKIINMLTTQGIMGNIQAPGPVGSGKTYTAYALSAARGLPLYAITAQPDQGVEIVEGETKMVGSELTFVRAQLADWAEDGGLALIDEFVLGRTDQMFSAFAELLEYPYHIYENGITEIVRNKYAVAMIAYNNGIVGGKTISQPLLSRFNMSVAFTGCDKDEFVSQLAEFEPGLAFDGYDRSSLAEWVYMMYEATLNELTKSRAVDVVTFFSMRACKGVLLQIAAGIDPTRALQCFWSPVEHYKPKLAETLRLNVYPNLPACPTV